jgi:hypothetical protein
VSVYALLTDSNPYALGTPNRQARLDRLLAKLRSSPSALTTHTITETIENVSKYFQNNWENIRFFTFAENEQFLNSVVDLAVIVLRLLILIEEGFICTKTSYDPIRMLFDLISFIITGSQWVERGITTEYPKVSVHNINNQRNRSWRLRSEWATESRVTVVLRIEICLIKFCLFNYIYVVIILMCNGYCVTDVW